MDKVSRILHDHYQMTFNDYGATSKGVDWGDKEWAALLRQRKMLEILKNRNFSTILDVGCGYGALADLIHKEKFNLKYCGIDVVEEMIREAKKRNPSDEFICGDILKTDLCKYDYVVCNGILTQKAGASLKDMNFFCNQTLKKMYEIANIGVVFNVMSTHVNYQKDNLYYRNPAELIGWCMSELTPHIRLDCAYDLWYEYTVFLYKPNVIKDKI